MMSGLRAPKELWLGVLYVVTGLAGFIISREYPFGSGVRMGPGYFPTIVCIALMLFGIGAFVRAFLMDGAKPRAMGLGTIGLIIGSLVAFSLLLERAGFVLAALVLLVVSASASSHFKFSAKPVAGAVALVLICALVFIKALGVPMPWIGTWVLPLLPAGLVG